MRVLRTAILSLLVVGTVVVCIFRAPLRNFILTRGVMLNDAPTEGAIERVVDVAKDREGAIRALWDTRKIVHREAAMRLLASWIPARQGIPAQLESWVVGAAMDPDMNVRETALGILRDHKDPALAAICMAEIQDIDPQARLLGLDNLKPASAAIGVPSVVPLMDDADPLVVAKVLKLLENWTGQSFGVKLHEIVPVEDIKTGAVEYRQESKDKAAAGAERAKTWWAQHRSEFAPVHLESPASLFAERETVPAGDFSLSTLEGRRVRLSELRGKVVLINFWTTWCPACLTEMPTLNELQKRHDGQLAILGVSLDAVPDEDGDVGGDETAGSHANTRGHAEERPSPNEIRKKVARMVKTRAINYTIVLDEKNEAGGRFNGGELPTTVIVDAQGNVRRRFVGARSLPVLEAMIAQASQPLH